MVSKRQQIATRPNPSKTSNENQKPSKPVPPSQAYRHYDHSSPAENQTYQEFNQRNSFALNVGIAGVVTLAFIAAIGTYLETRRQAIAAEGQLSEAKRQTAIAEKGSRPYIFPVIEGDRLLLQGASGPPNSPGQTPASYNALVGFHNYGSVPATIIQTEVLITTRPFDDINRPVNPKTYLTNGIVSSNATFDQEPYFMPLSPSIGRNLVLGDDSLFIQGRVFYTDASGDTFHTFFCYLQPTRTHDIRRVLQRVVGVPGCLNEAK